MKFINTIEDKNIESIKYFFLFELSLVSLLSIYWLCFLRNCNFPYCFISFLLFLLFLLDVIFIL
jgi:hypothetical protein